MSDIFISYAREREDEAHRIAEALRARNYGVWRDDEIPAHRSFGDMIEERLKAAKVVLVLWSAAAAKSEWVRSEASRARAMGKLVQLTLDKSPLPIPFDQIQCANLVGWMGDPDADGVAEGCGQHRRLGERDGAGAQSRKLRPALRSRANPPSPCCRSRTCRAIPSRTTSPMAWWRRSRWPCRA